MQHFLGVMSADLPVLRDLTLEQDVAEIVLTAEGGIAARLGQQWLALPDIDLGALAFVAMSSAGLQGLARARAILATATGAPSPVTLIDLSETAPDRVQTALHLALCRAFEAKCHALLHHNLALSRGNAALRMTHMRLQEAFALLAASGVEAGVIRRAPVASFLPAAGVPALALPANSLLEQRLPRSSAGLCDVAFALATDPMPQSGTLNLTLRTLEDDQVRANWRMTGQDLGPWMRVSLPAGLGPEPLTPVMQMRWSGPQPLSLHQSLGHPDPRYQARLSGVPRGRMLALRRWDTLPGCDVPYCLEGKPPQDQPDQPRLLPATRLAEALNLTSENPYFHFVQDTGALTVHVVADGISAALLPDVVAPGCTGLAVDVQTRSDRGPVVEYAIALAPASQRPATGEPLPVFEPAQMTDWYRLDPMTAGEVHLALAAPIPRLHDLYLMTRLPAGSHDIAFGWSTFSRIRICQ